MKNKDVLALSTFIYENYPNISDQVPKWKLLSLLDQHRDKISVVKHRGVLLGSAFYLKLTDDSLEKIFLNEVSITDPEDLEMLMSNQGDNLHFIYVVANNMRVVLRGLRNVIEKEDPHTVSWFNPDLSLRFIKYRRAVCHK